VVVVLRIRLGARGGARGVASISGGGGFLDGVLDRDGVGGGNASRRGGGRVVVGWDGDVEFGFVGVGLGVGRRRRRKGCGLELRWVELARRRGSREESMVRTS